MVNLKYINNYLPKITLFYLLFIVLLNMFTFSSFSSIIIEAPVKSYPLPNGHWGISFSPDGTKFLSFGDKSSRAVTLWEIGTDRKLWVIETIPDHVFDATFSSDNAHIAIAYRNSGMAQLINAQTGEIIRNFYTNDNEPILVEFSPDNRFLAVGGRQSGISIFHVNTGEVKQNIIREKFNWHNFSGEDLPFLLSPIINSLVFHPNSNSILCAINERSARIWDINTGEQTKAFVHPLPNVNGPVAAFFRKNGDEIITVDKSTTNGITTIRIWENENRVILKEIDIKTNKITINTSKDLLNGNMIFIGGDHFFDGSILAQFIDLNSRETVCQLKYPKPIQKAELSADEKWMLTTNFDGNAHLWDLSPLQKSNMDDWYIDIN